jgi:hypothetical protein
LYLIFTNTYSKTYRETFDGFHYLGEGRGTILTQRIGSMMTIINTDLLIMLKVQFGSVNDMDGNQVRQVSASHFKWCLQVETSNLS